MRALREILDAGSATPCPSRSAARWRTPALGDGVDRTGLPVHIHDLVGDRPVKAMLLELDAEDLHRTITAHHRRTRHPRQTFRQMLEAYAQAHRHSPLRGSLPAVGPARPDRTTRMAILPADTMTEILRRSDQLSSEMASGPDHETYARLAAEYAGLEDVVAGIRAYRAAETELAGLREMLADPTSDREMRDLASAEIGDVEKRLEALSKELLVLLLPKDAADAKGAILRFAPAPAARRPASSRRSLPHVPALRRGARLARRDHGGVGGARPAATAR